MRFRLLTLPLVFMTALLASACGALEVSIASDSAPISPTPMSTTSLPGLPTSASRTPSPTLTSQATSIATPTRFATPVDLAWDTYRATGVYNLRYPTALYSIRAGQTMLQALWPGLIVIEPNDGFNAQLNQPISQTYRITITVHENTEGFTLDDPTTLLSSGGILIKYAPSAPDAAHPIQSITIAGEPAYKVDNLPIGAAGSLTQIMTIHNKRIYEWNVEVAQGAGDNRNQHFVEEILATFTFE